jgi:predicted TIM-barrel fold metal-dependent hydrolase
MRGRSKHYDDLRAFCEQTPIVDCHDHTGQCGPKYEDPIAVVRGGYFHSDLWSALSDAENARLADGRLSLEQRWPILEKAWRRAGHTGYAQVTRRVLKRFYDVDELTLDALQGMAGRLLDLTDEEVFDGLLGEAGIICRLGDVWPDVRKVLDGTLELAPRTRMVISLPGYHNVRSFADVQDRVAPLGRTVTTLGEYVAACREIFEACKRFGAVAFKDQSAYSRPIDYGNPTRAEAEAVFNALLADATRSAGYPDGIRPLDDWLFHEFLRMAAEMDLPVQIHTGHMAGIRNEITKTNAVLLTGVLDLHRDVRFDLFHANWPFDDELMFLAKNYPNVAIDFCWANIIDPVYCQRAFQRALSCVPHGKVHAYGSDFGGHADRAWAHAGIARDNLAIALSEMVDMEYLGLDEAKAVARRWLFDNPNEFFRLGLS